MFKTLILLLTALNIFTSNTFAQNVSVADLLNRNERIWAGSALDTELKPVILQGRVSRILTQKQLIYQKSQTQIISTLKKDKKISSSKVKEIIKSNIKIEPLVQKLEDRNLTQTGGAGIVELQTEKGRYKVQASSINNVDLIVPPLVNITRDVQILPIGVRAGSGNVIKIVQNSLSFPKEAMAQGTDTTSSNLKIAAYFDKNKNGKWDKDESVVPWAGIRIDLLNIGKQKTFELSSGWNTFSADSIGKDNLTASQFVNDLASQGCPEAGVSTVDNGVRKTYFSRDQNSFSGEDFAIQEGKVYSIRGCQVPFYFIGYKVQEKKN